MQKCSSSIEVCSKVHDIDCRAESAIVTALLHDVLDNTPVKVQEAQEQCGSQVALA